MDNLKLDLYFTKDGKPHSIRQGGIPPKDGKLYFDKLDDELVDMDELQIILPELFQKRAFREMYNSLSSLSRSSFLILKEVCDNDIEMDEGAMDGFRCSISQTIYMLRQLGGMVSIQFRDKQFGFPQCRIENVDEPGAVIVREL